MQGHQILTNHSLTILVFCGNVLVMLDYVVTPLSLALALAGTVLCLILLVIDLRHYLLPDRFVFPLGVTGLFFHTVLGFALLPASQMVLGAMVGGGLLWLVRWAGTKYYKQEAMGLGDVKLMIAGGMWLGPTHIITAIMVGAMVGLIHGLGCATANAIKTRTTISIKRLIIPAGPGFIIGLWGVFAWTLGPVWIQTIFP